MTFSRPSKFSFRLDSNMKAVKKELVEGLNVDQFENKQNAESLGTLAKPNQEFTLTVIHNKYT